MDDPMDDVKKDDSALQGMQREEGEIDRARLSTH